MKIIKRIFCLIGNYMPPKLNCYFYKFAGVKLNISKVWIGNKCYFDTLYPENIIIKDNSCISFGVTIVTHFDPTKGINKHKINKYKKNVIIESGVFIGPNSIILPGVTIKKNSFIRAGTVLSESVDADTLVFNNANKKVKLTEKKILKINKNNKRYKF